MYEVCDGLLEEACIMWERDGALLTTSFAMGHSRALFAQPMNQDGCEIDNATRTRIQALLAASTGAIYIGRIDESFIAERPASATPYKKGDLERLAESDPSIRTAIVVQATDTRSGECLVFVAISVVDDDGEHDWELGVFDEAEGQIIAEAHQSVRLSELITNPITDTQLRDDLRELGWALADSDDMGKVHPEPDDWDDDL